MCSGDPPVGASIVPVRDLNTDENADDDDEDGESDHGAQELERVGHCRYIVRVQDLGADVPKEFKVLEFAMLDLWDTHTVSAERSPGAFDESNAHGRAADLYVILAHAGAPVHPTVGPNFGVFAVPLDSIGVQLVPTRAKGQRLYFMTAAKTSR